jgi:hypothetical protein
MRHATFILIILNVVIPSINGMKQNEKLIYPFIFNEERFQKYFKDMSDLPLAKNFNYKTQFTQQCILGGHFTTTILSSDGHQSKNHIYNKYNEDPIKYLQKICSVVTFLFTMVQTTGEIPQSWIIKLKDDDHAWRKFFHHNLQELSSFKEDQYIFKAKGDHKDQIGALILMDPKIISPFALPYNDDEILVMLDSKDPTYLTLRSGKEEECGWSNRILEKTKIQKIWSGITHFATVANGTWSLYKKTYGSYVPKDGPICTEYLTNDLPSKLDEIFTPLNITPIPNKLFEIYQVLEQLLHKKQKDENDLDDKTKIKVEALLSYLRKNFNNLELRIGNEIIFNKKWLYTNAYLYKLLQKSDITETKFEHTDISKKYYGVLNQLRTLHDLIYLHNHDAAMVSYDTVWSQAHHLIHDAFEQEIQQGIPDILIKEYLLAVIKTIKMGVESDAPCKNLLEQHFFDEDNLEIIQQAIDPEFLKNQAQKKQNQIPNAKETKKQKI